MKPRTIEQLRHDSPGKFVFLFVVGAPNYGELSDGGTVVYQGILPVDNEKDMMAFERRFRRLLLSIGGNVRFPPVKVAGEEGE